MRERCRDEFYAIPTTPVPSSTDLDHTSVVSPTPSPQQQQASQQQPPQNVPSVLYTVQRVVTTTSQIQQAAGANYAVNSSLSSASNLPRSDVDCGMQNSPGEYQNPCAQCLYWGNINRPTSIYIYCSSSLVLPRTLAIRLPSLYSCRAKPIASQLIQFPFTQISNHVSKSLFPHSLKWLLK